MSKIKLVVSWFSCNPLVMSASSITVVSARLPEIIFYKKYVLEIQPDESVEFYPNEYEDEPGFADSVENAKKAINQILSAGPAQDSSEDFFPRNRMCEDAPCCGCCGQDSFDYGYEYD